MALSLSSIPWFTVVILVFCTLSDPLAVGFMFPVAPFAVTEWVPADEVGKWAGLLTSAYNIAGIPANVFWGKMSDHVGRPKIMALQLLGTICSLIAFGFSTNLKQALLARFGGGLFSAIFPLAIATMRDIWAKDELMAAFPFLGWSFGLGFTLGPIVGGLLSQPVRIFPTLEGGIFDTYPYLLSSAVCAFIVFCTGFAITYLVVVGTKKQADEAAAPNDAKPKAAESKDSDGGSKPCCPPIFLLVSAYLLLMWASIGSQVSK